MQKMEKPRKPLMFYYLIVLVVVILLNTLLFPRLMRQQITQVDYGTFIDMLERREVSMAQVEEDMVYFAGVAGEGETPALYSTVIFPNDMELINRLTESGCTFGAVKAEEMNP